MLIQIQLKISLRIWIKSLAIRCDNGLIGIRRIKFSKFSAKSFLKRFAHKFNIFNVGSTILAAITVWQENQY